MRRCSSLTASQRDPPALMNGLTVVGRVVSGVVGFWIVGAVCLSAVRTVVVPRSNSQRITRSVFLGWRRVIELLTPHTASFETIDARLSLYGPLSFVTLPIVWLFCVGFGFFGLHWAASGGSIRGSFLASGSSLFTLGVFFRRDIPASSLSFLEATLGLGLVSLLISYLPTIYGSYARRETLVGMLESRAGLTPSPRELLVRYVRIGALDQLESDLFRPWEVWFAELEESHTSFPGLAFFRSPRPERSWITAAGTVLDTAALSLSSLDGGFSAEGALCLRQGFLTLRRICDYFGIETPQDPTADDPISVSRDDFDVVLDQLVLGGLPVTSDRDAAWLAFQGWRVNYDQSLVSLAKLIYAPPGHWSSDRAGAIPELRLRRRRRRKAPVI